MPSWTWVEYSAALLFPMFIIVGVNIAVFTRMREKNWNDDTTVDGRHVKISALASIWPCVAVEVDARVPRRELRTRRKRVREIEKALRRIVRVSHVESNGERVRVVVRPLPLDIRSYDLARDVVPFVVALERAAAVDAESAGGSPVAVKATG
jgi:hypothetical protein